MFNNAKKILDGLQKPIWQSGPQPTPAQQNRDWEKDILSEQEFREDTKGCFYQDELRAHDFATRKNLQIQIAEAEKRGAEKERNRLLPKPSDFYPHKPGDCDPSGKWCSHCHPA